MPPRMLASNASRLRARNAATMPANTSPVSSAGKPGRSWWCEAQPAIRRGHDCIGAFVDDHRLRPPRRVQRTLGLAPGNLAEQLHKFPFVGRQDGVMAAQALRLPDQANPVSVDHDQVAAWSVAGVNIWGTSPRPGPTRMQPILGIVQHRIGQSGRSADGRPSIGLDGADPNITGPDARAARRSQGHRPRHLARQAMHQAAACTCGPCGSSDGRLGPADLQATRPLRGCRYRPAPPTHMGHRRHQPVGGLQRAKGRRSDHRMPDRRQSMANHHRVETPLPFGRSQADGHK